MRIGLGLLNAGESRSYSSLSRIAQHAEALGYASLWVTEREPLPLAAASQCPVFTGELHLSRKEIDCTLDALAIAAINTESIRLGINLPNVPFYSPIEVGRSLAALDVLSDGRVQLGLGLGWQPQEFQTVSAALSRPDTPASEFVRALRAVWDGRGAGFFGDHFSVPGIAGVTPIQRPYPPIALTAFAPAAVQRPKLLLRGGSPLSLAISSEEMVEALVGVRQSEVGQAGDYELVVRAVVRPTEGPIGESRAMFAGSLAQIHDDIAFVESLGAAELQFDLSQATNSQPGDLFDQIARLMELVPYATNALAA